MFVYKMKSLEPSLLTVQTAQETPKPNQHQAMAKEVAKKYQQYIINQSIKCIVIGKHALLNRIEFISTIYILLIKP